MDVLARNHTSFTIYTSIQTLPHGVLHNKKDIWPHVTLLNTQFFGSSYNHPNSTRNPITVSPITIHTKFRPRNACALQLSVVTPRHPFQTKMISWSCWLLGPSYKNSKDSCQIGDPAGYLGIPTFFQFSQQVDKTSCKGNSFNLTLCSELWSGKPSKWPDKKIKSLSKKGEN